MHEVISILKWLRSRLQDFTCFPFTFPCVPRRPVTASHVQRVVSYPLWHVKASVQAKSETRHKSYSNLPGIDHLSEGTALAWNSFTASNISSTVTSPRDNNSFHHQPPLSLNLARQHNRALPLARQTPLHPPQNNPRRADHGEPF